MRDSGTIRVAPERNEALPPREARGISTCLFKRDLCMWKRPMISKRTIDYMCYTCVRRSSAASRATRHMHICFQKRPTHVKETYNDTDALTMCHTWARRSSAASRAARRLSLRSSSLRACARSCSACMYTYIYMYTCV